MVDKNESENFLIPFYSKFPVSIVKGYKHWVWDKKNKKYLDFTTGIGVVSFGHANPKINSAVFKQMKKISHISNLFIIPEQNKLAGLIEQKAFPGKVFFCNSGAEANETALKMARLYGNKMNPAKNKILALSGSFHGRTIATITLTGQDKYRKGFEPLLQNIEFVETNNIDSLRNKFDDTVCAIFLEAVQGEGGVMMLSPEFMNEVAQIAKKYKALIIFDEIQAGIGKTGKYFAYQNFSIEPDMIAMAKALGNGFPIGAVLARPEIADAMPAGIHASTFGGNYAACAAGIAVMRILDSEMLDHIKKVSGYFKVMLTEIQSKNPGWIKEIRVYGLMIGIDLDGKIDVKNVINKLIDMGVLTLRAGTNVLRLLPPFMIGKKEVDLFCGKLVAVLKEMK